MRERSEKMYWNGKDSIHIYEESIFLEKHQYGGSTESTEMLCLVNFAIRIRNMDIEPKDDENTEGSRTLVSKMNVENTMDR